MSTSGAEAELPADVVDALRDEYALERELGRGGMATVYLAQDLKHKRPVALKLLHPELGFSLAPQRFRREIETAARLHHPHICAVYDSGEIPGVGNGPPRLWFTMPFVRGESLRDRLRREGKLPIEEALRITQEAAEALQYAHDEGVVHRDIKPENILLSNRGATLVADFGIARPMAPREEQHLTQAGLGVGTPAYMAPEQAMAERTVDARADQYALAATCYEMLAGAPPFTGRTAAAIIATRFREPTPSVRASRPEVSPLLDEALRRALALEPGDRLDSVERASALAPESPDTRLASGWYQLIALGNPVAALAEYRAGLQISPGRPDLLSATATAEMNLGRWAEALIDLERAARLDPRSPDVLGVLSDVYARMGRFQEARTAIDRARELRPSSMSLAYTNARIAAAEGDLDQVRAILQSMDAIHGPREVVAYVALREDLIWALDDERQRLLLQLTPADLDGGKADWALALAETHWLRGEHSRARAYGNTAVTEYVTLLYEWGDRAGRGQILALRAMALAYAGRTAEAIAEGERANKVQPPAERVAGPYSRYLLARIYLLAGEPEKAMDRIEEMLKVPDLFSPAWIRVDPTLAGLKRSARYREVVGRP